MLKIAFQVTESDISWSAIRSQGAGGQNVNEVASAVQMRLDLNAPGIPERLRERVRSLYPSRVNRDGELVVKSQEHRTQAMNRKAASERISQMLECAARIESPRKSTAVPYRSRRERLHAKKSRSVLKSLRRAVREDE